MQVTLARRRLLQVREARRQLAPLPLLPMSPSITPSVNRTKTLCAGSFPPWFANPQFAGFTQTGKKRRTNQEALLVKERGDMEDTWLAVCDGLGGHPEGEQAAWLAISALDAITEDPTLCGPREAIKYAHKWLLYKKAKRRLDPEALTTVVVARVASGMLHFAHLGNSRIYVARQDKDRVTVFLLTRDHTSLPGDLETGPGQTFTFPLFGEQLTRYSAANAAIGIKAPSHRLTRTLGRIEAEGAIPFEKESVPMGQFTLQHDDVVLLTSDGLWKDMWFVPALQRYLSQHPAASPGDITTFLMQATQNGPENTTVGLYQYQYHSP